MRTGIALGSNLEDRLAHLQRARSLLAGLPGVSEPMHSSRIYETDPVGTEPGAGAFLNAVVEVEFVGEPQELLRNLQAAEAQLGRTPNHDRNTSRTIDLDLLYAGDRTMNEAGANIPHPRLHLRRFVLQPLSDIRPELVLPNQIRSVAELLAELHDNTRVEAQPLAWEAHAPSQNEEVLSAPAKLARIRTMKSRGELVAALTAYDYPTARLLDDAGVDVLLVGDSLGMVVLGYATTASVTMEDILHHTRAVRRGTRRALLVADLPFASYTTPVDAVANARRLVEAGADAVKLEGGVACEPQIAAITGAGIPFMGHIGMLPQSVTAERGYRLHGKTEMEAASLAADAAAVQRAGAFAVVLELVKPAVSQSISTSLAISTVGIGSGDGCDGQILVSHDLFGLFPWFTPKHVAWQAHAGTEISAAAARFVAETKRRR